MKIERKSLVFDNLLTYRTRQAKADWQDGVFFMEDAPLTTEIYKAGPVFFSCSTEDSADSTGDFTYYLPINAEVEMNDQSPVEFLETFMVEDALVLRQADAAADFYAAYQRVRDYAAEEGIALMDHYYCVLLDVYGEYIIDLYVPIKEPGAA
ncbi:hypothetical protein V1498_20675 [Peribacillus sp. SCS-26]|uniref:hypothetical protein n=1 Tax=Paraperibacillus marinus TaxID=3115295 RepID=UPI003905B6BC